MFSVRYLSSKFLDKYLIFFDLLFFIDPMPLLILGVNDSGIPLVEVWHQILAEEHLTSLILFLGGGHVHLNSLPLTAKLSGLDATEHAKRVQHGVLFTWLHFRELMLKVSVTTRVSYLRIQVMYPNQRKLGIWSNRLMPSP